MDVPDNDRHVPAFMPLEDLGFLMLEGARALEFLQGQLTCDMRKASRSHAVAGAWCTPKGRVLCSLLAWPEASDRVILRLHADLLASTAEQLTKYAALSRVRISRADLCSIGLLGTLDAELRARLGVEETQGGGVVHALPDGALLQLDGAGARHELWVHPDTKAAWCERLRDLICEGSADDWRRALVHAGVAEVRAATRELFLPQMLGYDSLDRVSFRKGCYTGQEIVARTHYKGGVKRHLQRLQGEGDPPPVGTTLESGGQNAGTVVESAPIGDQRCTLLAVLADELVGDAPSRVFVAAGQEFRLPGSSGAGYDPGAASGSEASASTEDS